jgi:hypothetical protein
MTGLAEALVSFQKEMPTVHKAKTATVTSPGKASYRYTYADLADVMAAAVPILTKHGLSFTAQPRCREGGAYELVGMLRHTSGEADEGALPIFGNTPQALGSSITYARRYLLGCLTGIVTDDDVDGAAASTERTRRQKPPELKAAEAATSSDAEPKLSPRLQRKMFALFKQKGIPEAKQLEGIRLILNRPIESRTAMTDAEGERVCAQLNTRPDVPGTLPEPPEEPW